MSGVISRSGTVTPARVLARRVFIPKRVKEKIAGSGQSLTAHDVARPTMRIRWMLSALAILRKSPQKQRFHARTIGRRRCDIARWLEREHRTAACTDRWR